MNVNKALLLIPLILSIGLVSLPFSTAELELEECRNGLIIIAMVSNPTHTMCTSPETADRWVELGIATIQSDEPESILEIPEEEVPQDPIIPVIPFDEGPIVEQSSATDVIPEPTYDIIEKSDKPKSSDSPRKVGQQGVQASGILKLEVYDANGNLKHVHENHNLVVNVGLQALSDLAFGTTHVSGESAGGFTWVSVGTGGTAPAAGNTDCETQHGSKKQDLSVTNTALGAVINVSWVAELGAGTLQEICLTDNGSPATGNMFSRQTFAGVPILGTDTVNAEWTITFADSDGA